MPCVEVRFQLCRTGLAAVASLAAILGMARPAAAAAAGGVWRPLGPDGGSVTSLDADPAGTIYAGTVGAGIFRSRDGASWEPARQGLPSLYVFSVKADPVTPGNVIAATLGGIAISSDGGSSWSPVPVHGLPRFLAVSPAAHRTVFAYSDIAPANVAPLHRSDDGGATWHAVATDLPRNLVTALTADLQAPETLYAGAGDGRILKSTDGGAHWAVRSAPIGTFTSIFAFAIAPSQPTVIYAAAAIPGLLLESADSGASWTQIHENVFGAIGALAVDPSVSTTLIAAADLLPFSGTASPLHGLLRSTDGGQTWSQQLTSRHRPLFSSVLFVPQLGSRAYAGEVFGDGILVSSDGGASWSPANHGLAAQGVAGVTLDPQAQGTLYAAGDLGIAKSTDAGASWNPANNGLPTFPVPEQINGVVADPATPGLLYAGATQLVEGVGSGLFVSLDGAANWASIDPGFSVLSLAIDPRRPQWLYAVGFGPAPSCAQQPCPETHAPRAALSRDRGATWTEVQRIERPAQGTLTAVRLNPFHPQTVYAAGTRTFKSTNGGRNWQRLPVPPSTSPDPLAPALLDLAVDPSAPFTLYGVHQNGEILKSEDAGATFAPVGALPAGVMPLSLTIDPRAPGILYLATDSGVFLSADAGATWNPFGTGLETFTVRRVTLDPRPPATLYVATAGGGVFSLEAAPLPSSNATP
ncbi:MAG TPA: hypothetical protein VHR45_25890 [Thermoanaerobaculia bacterium]|nr:hypothetical protein [Thermoanaerobaculia bacterium]